MSSFTGAVHKTDKVSSFSRKFLGTVEMKEQSQEFRRAGQAVASDDTLRKARDKISFGITLDPLKKATVKATSLEICAPKEKHVQSKVPLLPL